MKALAERSVEPSSSTEYSSFSFVPERLGEEPFGELTLPAGNHWLKPVDIDHGRDELLRPATYRSMYIGCSTQDTTLYPGLVREGELVRDADFSAGSFRYSWPVDAAEFADLDPAAGLSFDATIVSEFSHFEYMQLIGDKRAAGYSKKTSEGWIAAAADLIRNPDTDSPATVMGMHLLSVPAGGLERSIADGIAKYECHVTSWWSEVTQEVPEHVLERIARLRSTPEDERAIWTTWPQERAFDDAEAFVEAWSSNALRTPDVGLADDGEVNFLWEGAGMHVDLGFYGNGTFSYYAKDGDGKEYTDDGVPAHVGLPTDLLAILKA